MPTFGKRSNERPAGNTGQFDLFLKTFKDPQTRITLLEDDPKTWIDIKEHYDHALKISYPCAKYEGAEDCVGCSYPVEHPEWSDTDTHFPGMTFAQAKAERKKLDKGWGVRDTSSKYIIPVIDPKGYISVYKIGWGLREDFISQFDVLGSVTKNEWIIKRTGTSFNDTNYTPVAVPGELRVPKAAVPGEAHISGILGKKYEYALEKYGIEIGEEPQAQPDPAPVPTEEQRAARAALSKPKKGKPDEAQAQAQAPDTGEAADAAASNTATAEPMFIPREASLGEIKDFLDSEPKVEYAPKAGRQTLVMLAEKKLTESAGTHKGWSDEPPF